jgi:hypothetical protein
VDDWKFWFGIVIGAAVAVPFSIASNLMTPSVQSYINRRRAKLSSARQRSAVEILRYAESLSTGKRDKVGFYAVNALVALTSLILAVGALLGSVNMALTVWSYRFLSGSDDLSALASAHPNYPLVAITFAFVSFAFGMASAHLTTRVLDIYVILDDLEQYRAQLISRFGEDALREPP